MSRPCTAFDNKVLDDKGGVVHVLDRKHFEPRDGGLSISGYLAAVHAAWVADALSQGGAKAERVRQWLKELDDGT